MSDVWSRSGHGSIAVEVEVVNSLCQEMHQTQHSVYHLITHRHTKKIIKRRYLGPIICPGAEMLILSPTPVFPKPVSPYSAQLLHCLLLTVNMYKTEVD